MCDESRSDIGRQTDIATLWRGQTAQDVDEALRHVVARVQTRDHAIGRRSPRQSGSSAGSGGSSCTWAAAEKWQILPAFAGVRPAFAGVRLGAFLPQLRRGTSLLVGLRPEGLCCSPVVGLPSRSSPRTGVRHPQASEGWWRRRESDLTGFLKTGLFLHFRRKSRPRNTRVPLNTRSIAPNQPQQDVEFSGRFAAPDPG